MNSTLYSSLFSVNASLPEYGPSPVLLSIVCVKCWVDCQNIMVTQIPLKEVLSQKDRQLNVLLVLLKTYTWFLRSSYSEKFKRDTWGKCWGRTWLVRKLKCVSWTMLGDGVWVWSPIKVKSFGAQSIIQALWRRWCALGNHVQ